MSNVNEGTPQSQIPAEATANIFVHPDHRLLRDKPTPPQYREGLLQQISALSLASATNILIYEPTSFAMDGEFYDMFDPESRFPTDRDTGYLTTISARRDIARLYNERLAELDVRAAVYHGSYLYQCVWHQIQSMHRSDDTDILFYKSHDSAYSTPPLNIPSSIRLGVVLEDASRSYTDDFIAIMAGMTTEDTKIYSIDDTRRHPSV